MGVWGLGLRFGGGAAQEGGVRWPLAVRETTVKFGNAVEGRHRKANNGIVFYFAMTFDGAFLERQEQDSRAPINSAGSVFTSTWVPP